MENFKNTEELIGGTYSILLGGLRASREVSNFIKINKTSISIGLDTAEKIGLENQNFICISKLGESICLLFSKVRKNEFIKVTNSQSKVILSCSLNGINKQLATAYLGSYSVVKKGIYQADKDISVVILKKD